MRSTGFPAFCNGCLFCLGVVNKGSASAWSMMHFNISKGYCDVAVSLPWCTDTTADPKAPFAVMFGGFTTEDCNDLFYLYSNEGMALP